MHARRRAHLLPRRASTSEHINPEFVEHATVRWVDFRPPIYEVLAELFGAGAVSAPARSTSARARPRHSTATSGSTMAAGAAA